MSVEENYSQIKNRMKVACRASGRDLTGLTLIAVSKKQSVEKIAELYRLGHRDFGENYAQEMVAKAIELEKLGCAGIRWHFIGHLQTNKAKQIAPYVTAVHSVDSERVAKALAQAWRACGRSGPGSGEGLEKLPIFVEVNISREESKSGEIPEKVLVLGRSISNFPELELQGLMCVPAASESDEELKQRFSETRELGLKLCDVSKGRLSMGMSSDFEIAIGQGATHIRVGTALFGERV